MQGTPSGPRPSQSAALFLLHGIAMAAWFVPLSPMLEAHGLGALRPLAFATGAVSALVTPLLVGALADRHHPPVAILRALALATAGLLFVNGVALDRGWHRFVVLGLIQALALVSTPTWSLLTSIVLAQLPDAKRQFGPLRAFGTFGWIGGCLLVSALGADASTRAAYAAGVIWLGLAAFTRSVPSVRPTASEERLTLRQRLGLDALDLLRIADHRVVFVSAALLAMPLAAFYPFTPSYLSDLGLRRTSAWMSLAQITEIIAMFALASLLARWRLKWILATGLGFAVLRYALFTTQSIPFVLLGVTVHGFAFTLFFVSLPIYLNERVEAAWRTRAQALLSLMTQGCGNLAGYLGSGWWLEHCRQAESSPWPRFWSGLAVVVACVMAYFLTAYHGRPGHPRPSPAG